MRQVLSNKRYKSSYIQDNLHNLMERQRFSHKNKQMHNERCDLFLECKKIKSYKIKHIVHVYCLCSVLGLVNLTSPYATFKCVLSLGSCHHNL
jgi:hypothetical protein